MEELRSVYADRFVLTLINNRMLNKSSFSTQENGAVLLSDEARRLVINEWQVKKKDIITHPFLQEKIYWGLVPFVQALLLARFIRGDLEEYPVFLWKRDAMLILITYDVNTTTVGGRKRLAAIAKICVKYGQRVQNSVFECLLDAAQYKELQYILREKMDVNKDSIRFYNLGQKYHTKIEHFGIKQSYDPEGTLMF